MTFGWHEVVTPVLKFSILPELHLTIPLNIGLWNNLQTASRIWRYWGLNNRATSRSDFASNKNVVSMLSLWAPE